MYLDRNENLYGPAPKCFDVLRSIGMKELSLYSRDFQRGVKSLLTERLAADLKIPEQQILLSEGSEDMLGEVHRHGTDRDVTALDAGVSANVFGNVEGALEGLVQRATGVARLQRDVIGFLHLAENLGFTQHHRVQAAGHAEEVFEALGLAAGVEFGGQRFGKRASFEEKTAQGFERGRGLAVGGGVQLDPVAGREDDRLGGQARAAKTR